MSGMRSSWDRFWFSSETGSLNFIRILLGSSIFINYAFLSSILLEFYGPEGWVPLEAIADRVKNPLTPSIFYYATEPWQCVAIHVLFLVSCFAFAAGWKTGWFKWVVFLGHLSYCNRNRAITYGADAIASGLLFVLALAPIGKSMSVDQWMISRRKAPEGAAQGTELATRSWGSACVRLVQIQMALILFFSGLHKLQGDAWWSGDAIWIVLASPEHSHSGLMWLAHAHWLINLITYGVLLLEISYLFLIWGRATRPYLLSGAILFHLGIGVFMGLYYFAAVCIAGHLSFLRPEWWTRWKLKPLAEFRGHVP